MRLRGLVFLLLCVIGGARRSMRINDSDQDAQQHNNTLTNGLEVSAAAREALIPGGVRAHVVHHAGLQTSAVKKEYRVAPPFRVASHRAEDTLMEADAAFHNDGLDVDGRRGDGISASSSWMGTGMGAGTLESPRVAATDAQADVLRASWAHDEEVAAFAGRIIDEPCTYRDNNVTLHGRLVWAEAQDPSEQRPGVVLVHTAVGPSDLFLIWRAQALAARGYVVLIADALGDDRGKGWDAGWAAPVRQEMMDDRTILTRRMRLAMQALVGSAVPVDASRIAAVGYCFGGRAVLDLLRSNPHGLRGVVSFHGIVDAHPAPEGVTSVGARALLCHADADPFVPPHALSACLSQLDELGTRWQLLAFGGGTLHGFTNPAQALNERKEFGYDEHAAKASWAAAKSFLEEVLQ